jgi:transposase
MKSIIYNEKLASENAELKQKIEQLEDTVKRFEVLVKYYEEQFRLAKYRQFGTSSEKSDIPDAEQMSLLTEDQIFNEAEATANKSAAEPELIEVEKHYRKHRRLVNDNLPEDIPVEKIEHALPEEEQVCSACGGALHVMGRESRRELVIVPAQVKVVEHICDVYSCRNCEQNNIHTPIVKAEMPEPVIKGSFASPELVAHIMNQKFVMGIPLYRQEQEFNRAGILLSRQTMSNWLIRCCEDWLGSVYDCMKTKLLEHDVLHADETTVTVLHEPDKTAQSNSYMWLYRTSGEAKQQIVVYEYQPDRGGKHAKEFLAGYKGFLMCDGYSGYHDLPDGITVVGCFAHARRKFHEALQGLPKEAQKNSKADIGMWYCNALFKLERKYAEYNAKERYKMRLEYSLPLAEDFLLWAKSVSVLPKTLLGKAVNYLIEQWVYLKNVYLDGRLEFSNNRAERSMKSFVIGRKSWLFSNTVNGAKSSAVIYSIVESAKENRLRPFEYLVWLLKTIPSTSTGKICGLLPGSSQIPDYCRMPDISKK